MVRKIKYHKVFSKIVPNVKHSFFVFQNSPAGVMPDWTLTNRFRHIVLLIETA